MANKKFDCAKTTNMVLRRANLRECAREKVRLRLIECGWRDQVRALCRSYLSDPKNKRTFDDLIQHITPTARSLVTDDIKKELLLTLQNGLIALNKTLTENKQN